MIHNIIGMKDTRTEDNNCICFSSNSSFSLSTTAGWNGTMYYSTDKKLWYVWNGETIAAKKLYIKGINNRKITGSEGIPWSFSGGDLITINGNLSSILTTNNILDWACYKMFYGQQLLTNTIVFDSNTINTSHSYASMYRNCSNLATIANFPSNAAMAENCYQYMFAGCTSLVNPPLRITTGNEYIRYSCANMFQGCTSLQSTPNLYIANSAYRSHCFVNMFYGCTGLQRIYNLYKSGDTLSKVEYETFKFMFGNSVKFSNSYSSDTPYSFGPLNFNNYLSLSSEDIFTQMLYNGASNFSPSLNSTVYSSVSILAQ